MDNNNQPTTPATETQNDSNKDGKHEKTFTQDEVNQLIGKYRSEGKSKAEADIAKAVADAKAEWERQAKMTEDERVKEASVKREKELADKEKALALRENTANAKELLAEKHIDTSMAKFLVTSDAEETMKNIEEFEKAYAKAIEAGVEDKLKGKTPEDKGGVAKKSETTNLSKGVYKSGNTIAF
nr:MAG TPA: capsid scaffolding protein [Caudoviricetes sp.]